MRHPRITAVAVAVAVAATVGGVTVASAAGSSTPRYAPGAAMPPSLGAPAPDRAGADTIQAAIATVHGAPETILEDAKGLPLYTYQPDTATISRVSGQLATLWPPLIAAAPTAAGAAGPLRSVVTGNGRQVSYDGHFLYTFVEDRPGQVTGQGVQNFVVATPDLSTQASTATTAPPATSSHGYGY
jgi:predicted lipoprotein with Yx(FWY)xxD motif